MFSTENDKNKFYRIDQSKYDTQVTVNTGMGRDESARHYTTDWIVEQELVEPFIEMFQRIAQFSVL